ncbi:MAG: hypothetical protein OEV66_04940 [Spirochaetia bacterium]|nr:hypothetical protein [Spirochaetia bacterium]
MRFKYLLVLLLLDGASGFIFAGDSDDFNLDDKSQKNQPALTMSGLLRNDTFYIRMPESLLRQNMFADVLETRLILDRSRDDWSFYADGRLYINTGEFQNVYGLIQLKLMRTYLRWFSPVGDFTLGKTYVNFGNSGLFNPFEIDKSIQFTDLQYARAGLYALEYYLPWQDLSGLKVYTGYNDNFDYHPKWGISPGYHIGKFDLGAVFNHSDNNKNVSGLYFKGDAFAGINGSWGLYLNDKLEYSHSEASAGIDYSFFDGKVITTALFYFNENGAENYRNYKASADSFLLARYYAFLSFVWIIDEFWSASANVFMNLIDNSMVLLPSFSAVIANGLILTFQASFATALKDAEFSRDKMGDFTAMIRVEGKF